MWHCVSKYLHDVHVTIDELAYSKFTADSTLLFPLLTEPEVFNIQAGARKTIYGIQPRPVLSCIRDPALETIHT